MPTQRTVSTARASRDVRSVVAVRDVSLPLGETDVLAVPSGVLSLQGSSPALTASAATGPVDGVNNWGYGISTDGQVYDVTDYGAVGDNTADDTPAILAAIDACKVGGGGSVYFPSGTYKVSPRVSGEQTFTVDFGNVAFVGDGKTQSTINFWAHNFENPQTDVVASRGNGFQIGDGANLVERVVFSGLSLQGQTLPNFFAGTWEGDLVKAGQEELWYIAEQIFAPGALDGLDSIPYTSVGWDIHHKAIGAWGTTDQILVSGCDCGGWRGEVIYSGGGAELGRFYIANTDIHHSNGSATSIGHRTEYDNCNVWAVYNGVENFCRGISATVGVAQGATIRNTTIRPNHDFPDRRGAFGIVFLGFRDSFLTVEDCTVEDTNSGAVFLSEHAHDVTVRRNDFVDTQMLHMHNMSLYAGDPVEERDSGFTNLLFEDNVCTTSASVANCITNYSGRAVEANTGWTFQRNTFTGTYESFFSGNGATDWEILDNDLSGVTTTLMSIGATALRPTWSGNTLPDPRGLDRYTSDPYDLAFASPRELLGVVGSNSASPDEVGVEMNTGLNLFPDGFAVKVYRNGATRSDLQGAQVRPAAWNNLVRGYCLYGESELNLVYSSASGKFELVSYTPTNAPPWTITDTLPRIRFRGLTEVTMNPTAPVTYTEITGLAEGVYCTIVYNANVTIQHQPGVLECPDGVDYAPAEDGAVTVYWDGTTYTLSEPLEFTEVIDARLANTTQEGDWVDYSTNGFVTPTVVTTFSTDPEPLKRATLPLTVPQTGYYALDFSTRQISYAATAGSGIGTIRVSHADGDRLISHNWNSIRKNWVPLGTFRLNPTGCSISVETESSQLIDFDALRVTFVGLTISEPPLAENPIPLVGDGFDDLRLGLHRANHPVLDGTKEYQRSFAAVLSQRVAAFTATTLSAPEIVSNHGVWYGFGQYQFFYPHYSWYSLARQQMMAILWRNQTPSNTGNYGLQGNPDVLDAIQRGVQWLIENRIGGLDVIDWTQPNPPSLHNPSSQSWFQLEFGITTTMGQLLMTMGDVLPQSVHDSYAAHCAIWAAPYFGTFANGVWGQEAWIMNMLAVGGASAATEIQSCFTHLEQTFENPEFTGTEVTAMFPDYGFIKANAVSMHGYLNGTLESLAKLILAGDASGYAVSQSLRDEAVAVWAEAMEPAVGNTGYALPFAVSRGQAVKAAEGLASGLASNMAVFAALFEGTSLGDEIKGWCKRAITDWQSLLDSVETVEPINVVSRLHYAAKVMDDASVAVPALLPDRAKNYSSVATALVRRATWSAAWRGSLRAKYQNYGINTHECKNDLNLQGWYQGVGTMYLDNGDGRYINDSVPTIDRYRLPGITVTPSRPRHTEGYNGAVLAIDWAGGTHLGDEALSYAIDYAADVPLVGGEFLAVFDSDLVARKSTFTVGDNIINLGAAINSTEGEEVVTVLDNFRIGDAGDNVVKVDGVAIGTALPTEVALSGAFKIWIQCEDGATEGLVSLQNATGRVLREARTGAWADISPAGESAAPVTRNFVMVETSHGVNPTDATYAYAVLPNATEAETDAFAASSPVTILSNTGSLQAIKIGDYTFATVWEGPATFDGYTVSGPCSFIAKVTGNTVDISVADPTGGSGTVTVDHADFASPLNFTFGGDYLPKLGQVVTSSNQAAYDTDAQDYFTRAEALGGSFDLTAINATYTEAYVKTAISDYVAGLKADGVWDDVTELYLLSGVTFAGLLAKLKYDTTATLTNNGFVSGDYLAAGPGAGLTGDGSSYLNTLFSPSAFSSAISRHFGVYSRSATSSANHRTFGVSDVGTWMTMRLSVSPYAWVVPDSNFGMGGTGVGFYVATRRSNLDSEFYRNGVSVGTDTYSYGSITTTQPLYLHGENAAGSAARQSDGTITFAHLGLGLTSAQAADLSTRTNALMTALGCNVY